METLTRAINRTQPYPLRPGRLWPLLLVLALPLLAGCSWLGGGELLTHYPEAPRIVAVGDLHGDLAATRAALRMAGAVDERDRWVGGSLVLVQLGDQLDRGGDERAILDLLDRLVREARKAGGAVHVLNGNHEIMNVELDLRYVTEEGFQDFQKAVRVPSSDTSLAAYPPEERARVVAFRPGGPYARRLARRNTIVIVGDNLFVHGGVLPQHVDYGIERINEEVRAWLRGEAVQPEFTFGEEGPFWVRLYSRDVGEEACETAAEVLQRLGASRMVVGHTVQAEGITSYCDGKVWAVDVGMAAAYGGPTEVLEIRGGEVRALRGGR